ncbi:MAG: hypothetical protein ACOYK8_04010 [Alphaproteobacteria bacterium]
MSDHPPHDHPDHEKKHDAPHAEEAHERHDPLAFSAFEYNFMWIVSVLGTFLVIIAAIMVAGSPLMLFNEPASSFIHARKKSAHNVQIKVTHIEPPSSSYGICHVKGKVVNVFKTKSGILQADHPVHFFVSCANPGSVTGSLGRGTLWLSKPAVIKAQYMEVYLNGTTEFVAAMGQACIIEQPTDKSVCAPDLKESFLMYRHDQDIKDSPEIYAPAINPHIPSPPVDKEAEERMNSGRHH